MNLFLLRICIFCILSSSRSRPPTSAVHTPHSVSAKQGERGELDGQELTKYKPEHRQHHCRGQNALYQQLAPQRLGNRAEGQRLFLHGEQDDQIQAHQEGGDHEADLGQRQCVNDQRDDHSHNRAVQIKVEALCLLAFLLAKGADVYVTGDIDHHTGIDAVASGLPIIDAGHYGTEYIFMKAMRKILEEKYPSLQITCAKVKSPYMIL